MTKRVTILSIFLTIFMAGQVLLCPYSALAEDFPFSGEIQEDKVNIRAGQSESFEKLGQLGKGEQVVVLTRDYNWYKIRLPSSCPCYISANFITILGDGVGKVSGDRVNVRARANISSAIVGQANKSDLVRILETKEGWCKIEPFGDIHGWISAGFVTFKTKDIPPERKVELPSRSIYPRRPQTPEAQATPPAAAQPAPAQPQEQRLTAIGVVVDLGEKSIAKDIRHRLVVDDKTSYYLQGHRWILEGFLNQRVRIEGKVLPQIKALYPVVLVTKINLIL
jgi:SH3-like domain-containing protein